MTKGVLRFVGTKLFKVFMGLVTIVHDFNKESTVEEREAEFERALKLLVQKYRHIEEEFESLYLHSVGQMEDGFEYDLDLDNVHGQFSFSRLWQVFLNEVDEANDVEDSLLFDSGVSFVKGNV